MSAQQPIRSGGEPAAEVHTAGPWLLVVGMHRSGTSTVTGALTALGFNMTRPDDLMQGHPSNPEHWESLTAYRINEELLARLGGSWHAPPDLVMGWDRDPEIAAGVDPATLLAEAYTEPGASVWKDPRMCLLLPFWRRHLPPPLAAVLVWRPPLEVARSLNRRNHIPIADGVALWERYNRSALTGLVGLETMVVEYEQVVDDPAKFVTSLVRWIDGLDGFDQPSGGWKVDAALSMISAELRHQNAQGDVHDASMLLAEQRKLADYLKGLGGAHGPLHVDLPVEESPWTSALIARRRATGSLQGWLGSLRARQEEADHQLVGLTACLSHERNRFEKASGDLEKCQADLAGSLVLLDRVYRSTSWRVTRPLRSVAGFVAHRRRSRAARMAAAPVRPTHQDRRT